MKSSLWCSVLLLATLTVSVASCKFGKSKDDANTGGNSMDQTVHEPNYVSCRNDADGSAGRCVQYDAANTNPIIIDWLKSACGKAESGFDGYTYVATRCAPDNRLGECVANNPVAVYSDYYYSPKFTPETAAKACQDSDGSWTSI